MHIVGRIDRKIYECITDDITTDEVIITEERIQHIVERHPNDYEQYYAYLKTVVENGASHSRYFSDELDAQDFWQKEEQMFDILLCI